MDVIDVCIIGAGPAGLTAALYCRRANKKVVVLDKGAPGGKLLTIPNIDNYPGFINISGYQLANNFISNVNKFNTKIEYGSVNSIKKENDLFIVTSDVTTYIAKTVIIATGLSNVSSLPNEKHFLHKGVSYCATCDGRFFKEKNMAVIGDNEHALVEANYLLDLASKIYLFLKEELSDSYLYKSLLTNNKIQLALGASNFVIKGNDKVESLEYKINGETKNIDVSLVLPLLEEKTSMEFLYSLNVATKDGFVITNDVMESNVKGLFAIGDIRYKKLRQVVTASSDGAISSIGVISYLAKYGRK